MDGAAIVGMVTLQLADGLRGHQRLPGHLFDANFLRELVGPLPHQQTVLRLQDIAQHDVVIYKQFVKHAFSYMDITEKNNYLNAHVIYIHLIDIAQPIYM